MYTAHYNLRKPPFNITPDPDFFYDGASHKDGLAFLRGAFDQYQGIQVITGAPGTGKNMLILEFLSGLQQYKVKTVRVTSTNLLVDDFLKTVASQLHIYPTGVSRDTVLEDLEKYFFEQYHLGCRVILWIDDADNLPTESLAVLRKLATLQDDNKKVVLVILSGQEELKQKLKESCFTLEPLGELEVENYIQHRLHHVGWKGDIPISDNALVRIYAYSQGVPRFINILCGRLLMVAGLEERNYIDVEDVESVVSDIRQEPINKWLPSCDEVEQVHAQISSTGLTRESAVELTGDIQQAVHDPQMSSTISADYEILEQSQMLLSFGSKLHESHHIKYQDVNVSDQINQLDSRIEQFKQYHSEQAHAGLEASARCFYKQLIEHGTSRERARAHEDISDEEYQSILALGKNGRRTGVARSVTLQNMCKVIDVANQNMKCIKLGVLGYAHNLETMFKDISGYDISFEVSKEADSSVLVWRISISTDVILYLIGLPINDFAKNDEYTQLMDRLTTATVTTSLKDELTAEEKISLLNSLIHCGPESSQLIGPYVDQLKSKSHFFFQGDATIPNISDNSNAENLMSAVLFPNSTDVKTVASI